MLRDVDVITLYHDKFAQSRKGYRLPQVSYCGSWIFFQLKCVGGSGFKHPQYYPKVVQCYNRGFDGRDVQWECKAELDKSVSFGAVNVNCEGYDYPEDEYIVYGSCAVSILMLLSPYEMYSHLLYLITGSGKHFFQRKITLISVFGLLNGFKTFTVIVQDSATQSYSIRCIVVEVLAARL